jgi:protein-disulfide isomerase
MGMNLPLLRAAFALVLALPVLANAQAKAPDDYLAARTKGSAAAPVTVYEMSDFQCPYCRRHALETFPGLEKDFVETGKVRWVFINFPLTSIHPNAGPAAEFAMCAAKVGKFWQVHDLLFAYQDKWAPLKDPAPFLVTLADSAGIPRSEILPCLQNGETRKLIEGEAAGAAHAGVASTPSFYIEGGIISGSAPAAVFGKLLDSIYLAKTGGK